MDQLSHGDLLELAQSTSSVCVSIYMPTSRMQPPSRGDAALLKDLIETAGEQLRQRGLRPAEVDRILEPAARRQQDSEAWKAQGDGLAMFLADGMVREFRLDQAFEPLVLVASEFYVFPLLTLPLVQGDFYVLDVSGDACRLLHGNRQRLDEVPTPSLSPNLAAAFSEWSALRVADVEFNHREMLLRRITELLEPLLRRHQPPLVYAGMPELFTAFRTRTPYANVVPQAIPHSLTGEAPDAAHQLASGLVERYLSPPTKIGPDRLGAAWDDGRATTDLEQIASAAAEGLVECLFIAADAPLDHEADIVNRAAVATLRNRGDVQRMNTSQMPEGAGIAASLRAPLSAVAVGR